MQIRKSFHFRLRPTKKQARALESQLDECRWLYNELLEQRKLAYEELDISLSKYQQSMLLPLLKTERVSLARIHSQVLQNVVDRLEDVRREKIPDFRDFAVCIDIIAFAIRKADFLLLAKNSNSRSLAIFA